MHIYLKALSLVSVPLLFSLSSPQPLIATPVNFIASTSEAEMTQDLDAEAEQLLQMGREQRIAGQLLEAAQSFEDALKLYQELEPNSLQNTTLYDKKNESISQLVEIYTSLEDSSQTVEFFKEKLAIARELGNRDLELKLLLALGEGYNSLGEYEQAVESAKGSLAIAQQLENFQAKTRSYITLASAYQALASSQSDYQKAIRTAISGLTTAWKIKDFESEAKALEILGSSYRFLGKNERALLFAKQAVKSAKQNDIPTVAASSLLTLADVYLEEGQYQQAITATEQSRDYLQNLQLPDAESTALLMQSLAYFGQGNDKKSLELAEQGLTIAREANNSQIEALALIVLSLNASDAEDLQNAIELINQSQEIAKQYQNAELEALSLEVLGEIYRDSGQRENAIAAYQDSISISDSYSAKARLARIYQDANLLGTAITYYKQAINKNEEEVPRRIPKLPIWLQQSFPRTVQELNGVPTIEVYRSLANLLLSQKRVSEAQKVLELLKGQELREYTGDRIARGQPAQLAITPTEEQILREYGSLIAFGQGIEECQQTNCPQLEQLLEQRAVLTEQYYQALEQLEAIIRNIRDSDEAFLDPNDFALKAQEIVETHPNTVLVYPLVLEDRIWLLWASKGGIIKSVEVPVTRTQLGVWVMRYRQLLNTPISSTNEVKTVGKQLYNWLIKPLEEELKANEIHHLVFSLDRSTRYIPMSALFDGEKYLIENYTVSTVLSTNWTNSHSNSNPSTMAASTTKDRGQSSSNGDSVAVASLQTPSPLSLAEPSQELSILALGVSDAVAGFPPLPHVPAELDAIVRQDLVKSDGIYPGQKFLNDAFDLFALRDNLANRQLLHIATHSEFMPGRTNKSFLLLGTGEKLAIPDIETWLDLRDVDLVVLSACETALGGPGLNGKEIAGIGYYFLKSGASSLVASLWHVDDESTRLLMEQFYHNLAQGRPVSLIAKAQALRQAQLALLKGEYAGDAQMLGGVSPLSPVTALQPLSVKHDDNSVPPAAKKSPFSHPYYWSAFILMGSED